MPTLDGYTCHILTFVSKRLQKNQGSADEKNDIQQFHQNQQNVQSPLTSTRIAQSHVI